MSYIRLGFYKLIEFNAIRFEIWYEVYTTRFPHKENHAHMRRVMIIHNYRPLDSDPIIIFDLDLSITQSYHSRNIVWGRSAEGKLQSRIVINE